MVHKKLLMVVKTLRLRYAVPFVLLLIAVYWMGIHPWMADWGSSVAEQQMSLPGDNLHPDGNGHLTKAITINAPPDIVWQWLVQIGQDRAGYYTYTWLENLFGADIHNTDEIRPEWQTLKVGDAWRLLPPDYLWGVGKEAASPVLITEPGHALVLEMFGAYVITPIDEHSTRLLVRGQSGSVSFMTKMVADPIVFTMERRMLLGLKARAEGRPDAPLALMFIAQLGWAATGIAVAGLFISQIRRLYWLALPLVATLPALLMGHDFQAALAAFIAAGITVLGFLIFGRSWWGPMLIIASVVLLTLLLAPEAYTVIGLTFALLLLVTVSAAVAGRFNTANMRKSPRVLPSNQ